MVLNLLAQIKFNRKGAQASGDQDKSYIIFLRIECGIQQANFYLQMAMSTRDIDHSESKEKAFI